MSDTLRFDAFLREAANGRARLPLSEVMPAFLRWRPELSADARKREVLAEALAELTQTGSLSLPRGKNAYDRSARPPLPAWVALVVAPAQPIAGFDHRTFPWVPELAFVPAMARLPNPGDAVAINDFFRSGGARRPMVPVKERSYSIFGYEKRLENVLASRGLGAGLTHELLRCYGVAQIPVHRTITHAVAPDALVLENEAAFDSFARWNRTAAHFRWIVYGRGNDVLKSAGFLRELQQEGRATYYFGDLDPQGVWIPCELSRKMVALGATPVRPLNGAYRFLSAANGQRIGRDDEAINDAWATTIEWLPLQIRQAVTDLFGRGHRVPQEALGWEKLDGMPALDLLGVGEISTT